MTAGVEGDTRQIEVHFIRRADVDDVRSFAAEEIIEVRVSPALETEQILQLTRRAGKTLGTASKNGYYIGPDLRMPLGVMAADAACPGDGDAKVRPTALSPFDQLFDLPAALASRIFCLIRSLRRLRARRSSCCRTLLLVAMGVSLN